MSNVLLGAAIGDAMGVPFESKPPPNPLFSEWDGKSYLGSEWHKLKPGQYSDDTQMSCMVAQSLIESKGFDPNDLSKRYVHWIASGEARGYGKTTYASIQNLINGKTWIDSGIVGSYGNGTAMRAAPFGIYFRNDIKSLLEVVRIDCCITHNSDEAIAGAQAIALATAMSVNNDTMDMCKRICELIPNSQVKNSIANLNYWLDNRNIAFSKVLEILGTRADVRQTVPSALYCFLRFDDCFTAMLASIQAGYDTDTTASIVGSLFGAISKLDALPQQFLLNIENKENLLLLDSQLYNRTNCRYF